MDQEGKQKKKTLHLISLETGHILREVDVEKKDSVDVETGVATMDPETQEFDVKRKLVRGKTPPKQKTLLDLVLERVAALEKRVLELEGKKAPKS